MTKTSRTDENIYRFAPSDYYNFYYERLATLVLSQHEYTGWPEYDDRMVPGVSRDHLEAIAASRGSVAIAKPRGVDKVVALPWVPKGSLRTINNEPAEIQLCLPDGRFWETDEWYIMYDSPMRNGLLAPGLFPTGATVAQHWQSLGGSAYGVTNSTIMGRLHNYCRQLAKVHNNINRNLDHQLKPYIVPTSPQMRTTVDTFFRELYSGAPYIKVDARLDRETFQVVQTGVPYQANEMLQTRRELWAEAISVLGITSETTKKERLIADEITMNRQEDTITLNARLMKRVDMCNWVNKTWGLNVSVNLADRAVLDPYTQDPFDGRGTPTQPAPEETDDGKV